MAVGLYTLDVGHGLAQVIVFPRGRAVLIDGGTAKVRGVVERFLSRFGIQTIVAYIATHNDNDHVGAAPHILSRFKTNADLWTIWLVYDRPSQTDLEEYVARRMRDSTIQNWRAAYVETGDDGGVRARRIYADAQEDAVLELIYPRIEDGAASFRTARPSPRLQNRTSACLRLTVGQSTALLTGDVDLIGFTSIRNKYKLDLRAHLLVVPHHGGHIHGTLETLTWAQVIENVLPKIAIVSTGRNTTIQQSTFQPFLDRGIPVVCTEITDLCYPGCRVFHPCVLGGSARDLPQVSGNSEFPDAVGCFGSIVAEFRKEWNEPRVRGFAEHQDLIDRQVRVRGTPYCRAVKDR